MVRNFFNRNRRTKLPETVKKQSTYSSANASEFGVVGQTLQQELHRLVAQANRLQIRCAIREGVLLVLTEHLLHVEPDPQHTFIILEQSVRELTPKLLHSDPTCSPTVHSRPLPVRIYLRVAGYQQPYAFHSFTLEPVPEAAPFSDQGNPPHAVAPVAPPVDSAQTSTVPAAPELSVPTAEPDAIAEAEPLETPPPVIPEPEGLSEYIAPAVPDIAWPDRVQKNDEPQIVEPQIEPQIVEPIAFAEPEIAEPEIAEPEIAEPEIAEPENASLTAVAPIAEPIDESETPESLDEPITALDTSESIDEPFDQPIDQPIDESETPEPLDEPITALETPESIDEPIDQPIDSSETPEPLDEPITALDTSESIDEPIDETIAETIEQPIAVPESSETLSEFSALTESVEPLVPPANFTIITDVDAFIAEPIDEPEQVAEEFAIESLSVEPEISQEPAIEPFEQLQGATEGVEADSDLPSEVAEEPIAEEILSDAIPEIADIDGSMPAPKTSETASETEASDEETIATTSDPLFLDEQSEAPEFNDAAISVEQSDEIAIALVPDIDSSVVESADDFEYSTLADIETSDVIESEPYQEIEPEHFDRTQTAIDVSTEERKNVDLFESNFDVFESTTSETELSRESDSDPLPRFDSNPITDATPIFKVEPSQSEDISPYENAELEAESEIAQQNDISNDISQELENHSIANSSSVEPNLVEPNLVEPILIEDNEQVLTYLDQTHEHSNQDDRSNQNGRAPSQYTTEPPSVEIVPAIEDNAKPFRLIPSVQNSASSFDRLPLDLGDGARKSFRSRLTLSNVLLTSAVGLFFVVSGAYVFTRPCVLGQQCEPLQKAQQLSQQALTTVQADPAALEVVDAYDQLTQANQLLATIPAWSKFHQDAQTLMAEYAGKIEQMSLVVKALNQANVAAKKSLEPPHPVQVWREVQWTWREAINLLQQVPGDSLVYPLAQDKLSEYQSNLESINSRIIIEQNAIDRLEAVKKAAEVTDGRSQIVNTIDSWQQTSESWETILDQLQHIPQGTMAHKEAQQLTHLYQLKLNESDNHRSQEERSATAYNRAIGLAAQASRLDQQGQWSQAIDYWRQAITTLKQVPESTTYSDQAQTLLNSYMGSLNQAEQSVKQVTLIQTVEPQIKRLCSGNYELCTYTLTTEAIRVQITPQYDQIIVQALRAAQLNQNTSVRAEATERVNQFLQSLASIGKTAQVPVELYSAAGVKLGTYDLNQSGYVVP